jgi:hypothetical protein
MLIEAWSALRGFLRPEKRTQGDGRPMKDLVQVIVKTLLEEDPPEYIEHWSTLRPDDAKRMDVYYEFRQKYYGWKPSPGDVFFKMGRTRYRREGGKWQRLYRKRNPAYWDQPQYFFIYPGPLPYAFIAVKQPRRITQANFRKAVKAIYRDATGSTWDKDKPGVDGFDKEGYEKRVSGEKPEPAYEVSIDGSIQRA